MTTLAAPISGNFTSVALGDSVRVRGKCNITLSFGVAVATINLERSFDNGNSWHILSKSTTPDLASFTEDVNLVIEEPESTVLYRWSCVGWTSGSVFYRIGTSTNN